MAQQSKEEREMALAARIDEIVAQLCGSCMDLNHLLTGEERGDKEILDGIDSEIFCCARCEWWCEQNEANAIADCEGDVCDDCLEEGERDDG